MHTISHLLSGFLVLRILIEINPDIYSKSIHFLLLSVFFANVPDIDILWSKTLNDHHVTYFHSLLFWSFICFFLYLFLPNFRYITILFYFQVVFHLFADLITGRTAGLAIFYPLSKKEYSLIKLNKKEGNFSPLDFSKYKKFWIDYLKNTKLVIFEGFVVILGILSIFF